MLAEKPKNRFGISDLWDGRPGAERDVRKALDDLIARSLAYRRGPELKALFDFEKKFPHIAPYNVMLLHVQNPGIVYALRAKAWIKIYARRIRPAARPYLILQTMGPVDFVFDLGDTEPIDPKRDLVPEIVNNPFPAKGSPPFGALPSLIKGCSMVGIQIQFRDLGTNVAGQVQQTHQPPGSFHIALNSKHTETQHLGTLVHELGHIFCGHLGETKAGFWPDRDSLDLDVREFEAETVAYLFTERLNLDIGSEKYLSGYLTREEELPEFSLDAILKAVGKIEAMCQDRFRPRK
ncbi:MAG: ImmA/IrrE family metallo-endopeptidase [Candidatus Hydrogenedentes bacterium]|nr:ImmA/IrrE family metallo-endopeptidase [Candidatus Hydrogenedentota bacterium]